MTIMVGKLERDKVAATTFFKGLETAVETPEDRQTREACTDGDRDRNTTLCHH